MGKSISIPGKNIIIFYCSSLKTLGLQSRVSLPNKTGQTCTGHVQLFTTEGEFIAEKELNTIKDKFIDNHELEKFYLEFSLDQIKDYVFLFSLVPASHIAQETKEIELCEISRLNETQDFYIEHYIENSISAGVLYQASPIMNNHEIVPKFYFFMQAPKIFLTENQDTMFQFFNPNISREQKSANLYFIVRDTDDTILCKGKTAVKANGTNLVSIKETLRKQQVALNLSSQKFLHFEAFSDENIFISLTMQFNKTQETMDLEHTLSPHYYLQKNKMDKKAAHHHYSRLFSS